MRSQILTFEEVEKDRKDSARDLENLQKVVDGIRGFMQHNAGEARHHFRFDLVKWEALFAEGSRLHESILKKHAELRPKV